MGIKKFVVIFAVVGFVLFAQLLLVFAGNNFYPNFTMPMFSNLPVDREFYLKREIEAEIFYSDGRKDSLVHSSIMKNMPRHGRLPALKKYLTKSAHGKIDPHFLSWALGSLTSTDTICKVDFYWVLEYREVKSPDIIHQNERELINTIFFAP